MNVNAGGFKGGVAPIKYLTVEQVQRLLAAVSRKGSARDRAIFITGYYHGLRISEVGKLERSGWRDGRLYVNRAKGSISAEYKAPPEVARALNAWCKIRDRSMSGEGPLFPSERRAPISVGRIHAMMKRFSAAAGIPEELAHFHVLRHSIAVHMTRGRFSEIEIRDWLGHKDVKSTAVYAVVASSHRDEISDRVGKFERRKEGKGWRK